MSKRNRVGYRRHSASFFEHNGTTDDLNQRTYDNDNDWLPVVVNWPVELVGVSGGEVLRGRQVSAESTHVLFGEAFGGAGIEPTNRCVIAGTTYGITSVIEPDGDNMELRVELKRGST